MAARRKARPHNEDPTVQDQDQLALENVPHSQVSRKVPGKRKISVCSVQTQKSLARPNVSWSIMEEIILFFPFRVPAFLLRYPVVLCGTSHVCAFFFGGGGVGGSFIHVSHQHLPLNGTKKYLTWLDFTRCWCADSKHQPTDRCSKQNNSCSYQQEFLKKLGLLPCIARLHLHPLPTPDTHSHLVVYSVTLLCTPLPCCVLSYFVVYSVALLCTKLLCQYKPTILALCRLQV